MVATDFKIIYLLAIFLPSASLSLKLSSLFSRRAWLFCLLRLRLFCRRAFGIFPRVSRYLRFFACPYRKDGTPNTSQLLCFLQLSRFRILPRKRRKISRWGSKLGGCLFSYYKFGKLITNKTLIYELRIF